MHILLPGPRSLEFHVQIWEIFDPLCHQFSRDKVNEKIIKKTFYETLGAETLSYHIFVLIFFLPFPYFIQLLIITGPDLPQNTD